MDQIGVHRTPKFGKKIQLVCDCGCGTVFYRYRNKVNRRQNFLNCRHQGFLKRSTYLREHCGPYLPLATVYLEGAAKLRYRSTKNIRILVSPFFRYLNEHGIESLGEIDPGTITAFQTWAQENGYASASTDTSALSTFFHWAIVEEHYVGENPVIPALHGKRKKARTGRPYSDEEMAKIRHWLEERGNERLRAFFEIASESGLRNNEVCRLHLIDIALEARQITVRLPNKGMRERPAFFSDRASTRIREWLAVRKMECGHELLFHNYLGGPLSRDSILNEFKRALCKTYEGQAANETGLETFSVHRLRHTLTSYLASGGADGTTLMTCLGWVSPSSIDGYTRLSHATKVQGFVTAMDKVEQQIRDAVGTRILSPDEFLLLADKMAS